MAVDSVDLRGVEPAENEQISRSRQQRTCFVLHDVLHGARNTILPSGVIFSYLKMFSPVASLSLGLFLFVSRAGQ